MVFALPFGDPTGHVLGSNPSGGYLDEKAYNLVSNGRGQKFCPMKGGDPEKLISKPDYPT